MVDDDGRRTPDHGHPISSPCEPNSSGELIKITLKCLNLQYILEGLRLQSSCKQFSVMLGRSQHFLGILGNTG